MIENPNKVELVEVQEHEDPKGGYHFPWTIVIVGGSLLLLMAACIIVIACLGGFNA